MTRTKHPRPWQADLMFSGEPRKRGTMIYIAVWDANGELVDSNSGKATHMMPAANLRSVRDATDAAKGLVFDFDLDAGDRISVNEEVQSGPLAGVSHPLYDFKVTATRGVRRLRSSRA